MPVTNTTTSKFSRALQKRKESRRELKPVRSSVIAAHEGDTLRTLPNPIEIEGETVHDGVRIRPKFMEFKDASEGTTFKRHMTLQNTGTKPAFVRICEPNSMAFTVETLKRETLLSPGLTMIRMVTYSFKRPSLSHAMIPIEINGKIIDYHVVCTLSSQHISIEPPSIDFGIVDIGCSSGINILTVKNSGGKSTRFTVDLGSNDLEINVKPLRGIVGPRGAVCLKVELIGTKEGSFYGEFWIKSTPNLRVPVRVNVILPRLVIYHPNTTGDFTLVDFPTTFVDTRRYDTLVLRNLSSQASSFVVLGEIDGELRSLQSIDREICPAYGAFKIRPVEGRMGPFEGVIFSIVFAPTRALSANCENSTRGDPDFMAFLRILRVHCTEVEDVIRTDASRDVQTESHKARILETSYSDSTVSSVTSSTDQTIHEAVRLCLHGEVERARLVFTPDALHLGELQIEETVQRVISIQNPSPSSPVTFEFLTNPIAKCEPKKCRLLPKQVVEVAMKITGGFCAMPMTKLSFDVIADSIEDSPRRTSISEKVETCYVPCYVANVRAPTKSLTAKFVMGITPLVSNEVGFNTELATFGSTLKKPRQAILQVHRDPQRVWANRRGIHWKAFPDSVPGYPNDTRRSLRPWSGPAVRSIFTGKLRYKGQANWSETLSPEEGNFRAEERIRWRRYLERRGAKRRARSQKRSSRCVEPQTEQGILDLGPKLPRAGEDKVPPGRPSIDVAATKVKDAILVPLSPLQIYNVKVSPTVFAFGAVAPKSLNHRLLSIQNKNRFPVMVRLVSPAPKSVRFIGGDSLVLQPGVLVSKLVELRADRVGKFNGYIDYVINDNHSFELTVTADVVRKSLTLDTREVLFGKEYHEEEAYRPSSFFVEIKNKLDAKTAFKWIVPASASFLVQPSSGAVRGNRGLFVVTSYEPDPSRSHHTEAVMHAEGGSHATLGLNALLPVPDVAFIDDTLDLGIIPLNAPTTVFGVLHNAEYTEVVYEVDLVLLPRGVEVSPRRAAIPPRGIAIIEILVRFEACFEFSTAIRVLVQKCLTLQLKVKGRVSFPMLSITPQRLDIGRVSASAFKTHRLVASNIGKATLKMQLPLEEYPEFRASLSPDGNDPGIGREGIVIAPGASQAIFLHFQPADLASYSFYLPIVLNELLGPALLENPRSQKPGEYLKYRRSSHDNLEDAKPSPLPARLPTVHVDCTVAGKVISFSKLDFLFDVATNQLSDELRVFNEAHLATSFILRVDEFSKVDSLFRVKWVHGVEPKIQDLAILCTLEPGEETTFLLEFQPARQGHFHLEAPIFVRGQLRGNVFNRLRLSGVNPECSISSDVEEIYFSPIRPGLASEESLHLKVEHFGTGVTLVAEVLPVDRCTGVFGDEVLRVSFPNGNIVRPSQGKSEDVLASILFSSDESVSFRARIRFRDTDHKASHTLTIYAICDNSLLTTHAYRSSSCENCKIGKSISSFMRFFMVSEEEDDTESLSKRVHSGYCHLYGRSSRPSTHSGRSRKSSKKYGSPMRFSHSHSRTEDLGDGEENPLEESKFFSVSSSSPRSRKSPEIIYPFFPVEQMTTDFNEHMKRTLKSVEQWLYAGPLKFALYPSVISGITAVLSDQCSIKATYSDKRKTHTVELSFLNVLESLVGPQIYDHVPEIKQIPENDVKRVSLVLKVYGDLVNFLIAQGACLPHVEPYLLISYNEYSICADGSKEESIFRKDTFHDHLPRMVFESRSKQCWLDVILQTYKCLVLSKISATRLRDIYTTVVSRVNDSFSITSQTSLSNVLNEKIIESIVQRSYGFKNRSSAEAILLAWLEHNYTKQCSEDWMKDDRVILNPNETREKVEPRTLDNFENDLADGLVLMAVTAAYCPFLINSFFRNIYLCPKCFEEIMHNAICVVASWRKIRLGFVITPMDIAKPNCVQMIILIAHLFEVLPTYVIRSKVKFSCPLTESTTRQINFTNPTECRVSYILQFLENDSHFFSLLRPTTILRLNPHDSGHVKVQFHARKIKKARAYLILCGSAIGPHFARSYTFALEGAPNRLGIVNQYDIRSKLYRVIDKTLTIQVPYNHSAEYDIWMANEEPTKPASLKMAKWSDLSPRKVPRRIFLNQISLVVLEDTHAANLSITVACISPRRCSYWIVFQSQLGDFIIQINSKWSVTIMDRITVEWTREKCICADPSTVSRMCPLNIGVKIPSRNTDLWKCIGEMFRKTLNPKESLFWSRHLDTNIGLRLIHWLMGDHDDSVASEIMHIFNKSVKYRVTSTDKSTNVIVVPPELDVEDVRPPEEYTTLYIHINESSPQLYETMLTMTSTDEKELRCYKMVFLCNATTSFQEINSPRSTAKSVEVKKHKL